MPRRLAFVLLAALSIAALALAACGDDESSGTDATATPAATETAVPVTSVPTSSEVPERGQAPIFWRVCPGFPEVNTGEICKIVFRVTNGFAEDVLPIEAAIDTTQAAIDFEAMRVTAPGDDKGTFYTVNLEFPRQGVWHITVTAGPDTATMDVDVGGLPDPGSSG